MTIKKIIPGPLRWIFYRNDRKIHLTTCTGGDLTDTLNEQLFGGRWSYRFAANETFRLKKGKIFKARLQINQEYLTQDFQANTNRYQSFFLLDSTFQFFRQDLNGRLRNHELDLGIYGRKRLYNWYAGLRIINETSSYKGESTASSPEAQTMEELGQAPSQFQSFRATVYGMLNRKVQKKGELSSGFSLGAGKVRIDQEMKTAKESLLLQGQCWVTGMHYLL